MEFLPNSKIFILAKLKTLLSGKDRSLTYVSDFGSDPRETLDYLFELEQQDLIRISFAMDLQPNEFTAISIDLKDISKDKVLDLLKTENENAFEKICCFPDVPLNNQNRFTGFLNEYIKRYMTDELHPTRGRNMHQFYNFENAKEILCFNLLKQLQGRNPNNFRFWFEHLIFDDLNFEDKNSRTIETILALEKLKYFEIKQWYVGGFIDADFDNKKLGELFTEELQSRVNEYIRTNEKQKIINKLFFVHPGKDDRWKIIINEDYDSPLYPRSTKPDSYWRKFIAIAEQQQLMFNTTNKGVLDYFNSNQDNPLYKYTNGNQSILNVKNNTIQFDEKIQVDVLTEKAFNTRLGKLRKT